MNSAKSEQEHSPAEPNLQEEEVPAPGKEAGGSAASRALPCHVPLRARFRAPRGILVQVGEGGGGRGRARRLPAGQSWRRGAL